MPVISYSYKKPSRNLIFNFTSVTSDCQIEEKYPDSCDCFNSPYKYGPCGHILTGDLSIVKDQEVKKFLLKGPKYRPPSKINWQACRDAIYDSISNYCIKWCKRECADKHALNSFRNKILCIVDKRIEHFKTNYYENFNKKMSISRIKQKLNKLSEIFVFAPGNKAANNVVVI